MEFIVGFGSLFVALLGMGAVQVALAILIMFLLNKYMKEKLTETNYGDFDFDNFQKPAFNTFLLRMAIIFVGTTLILHLLEYLLLGKRIILHLQTITFLLFVLETAGIGAGLYYIFHLDKLRLVILTASSALIYLMFFELLYWSRLLN